MIGSVQTWVSVVAVVATAWTLLPLIMKLNTCLEN